MLESPVPAEHLLAYVSIRRRSSVQPAADMHLRDGTAGVRSWWRSSLGPLAADRLAGRKNGDAEISGRDA